MKFILLSFNKPGEASKYPTSEGMITDEWGITNGQKPATSSNLVTEREQSNTMDSHADS